MAAGDVVYTAYDQSGSRPFAVGMLTCDADADVTVYCGFQPSMIEWYYVDAGATLNAKLYYTQAMAAGEYIKVVAAGDITFESSGGPALVSDTTGEGFSIPNALMDNDADEIYWTAWR